MRHIGFKCKIMMMNYAINGRFNSCHSFVLFLYHLRLNLPVIVCDCMYLNQTTAVKVVNF